jgi:hypothetical protein
VVTVAGLGEIHKMKMQTKYRVRRWVLVLVFLALAAWAFDATTPEQCKVPVEQMSSFCKDILFP